MQDKINKFTVASVQGEEDVHYIQWEKYEIGPYNSEESSQILSLILMAFLDSVDEEFQLEFLDDVRNRLMNLFDSGEIYEKSERSGPTPISDKGL